MKKFIATLFALMLIAAVMPAAWAARGTGSLGVDTETDNDNKDGSNNNGSVDDGRIDDSDDRIAVERETSTGDSSDDVNKTERNETSDESRNRRVRTEYKDGFLRARNDFSEGGRRIRDEFRSSGFAKLSVDDRKELLSSLQDRRQELVENRREAMKQVREEIKEDADRIKELRNEYSGERDGFIKARDQLKVECANTRSDDCKKAKKDLNTEAKGFMGNAAEQMLRIIESMKVRVEANENIDNETAAAVIAQLEARGDAISAAQAKIGNLSNSTDLNATKEAAADLRNAWAQARVTIRLTEGLLTHARYAEFIGNLDLMESRFTEARAKLVAEGKNVTRLDADIAAFSAKIDAASASYADAQESYIAAMSTAKTEAEANTLLKETRDQLKTSQKGLQDARNDLRAIIKDIRGLSSDVLRETAAKVHADAQESASVEDEVDTGVEDQTEVAPEVTP